MAQSPSLGITLLTENQAGKEATINQAFVRFERATQRRYLVTGASPRTLSVSEFTEHFLLDVQTATAAYTLIIPASLEAGTSLERIFAVKNRTDFPVIVQVAGTSNTFVVESQTATLLYSDGSSIGLINLAGEQGYSLDDLADVNTNAVVDGFVLSFNGGQWVATAPQYVTEGGLAGQVLAKDSDADGDVSWITVRSVPSGGTEGQVLTRQGSNFVWADAPGTDFPEGTEGQVLTIDENGDVVFADPAPSGIGEAPSDGVGYVRKNGAWAAETIGGGGGIEEAPLDGKPYVRKNGGWVEDTGGGTVPPGETEPASFGNPAPPNAGTVVFNLNYWGFTRVVVPAGGRVEMIVAKSVGVTAGTSFKPAMYAADGPSGAPGTLLAAGPTFSHTGGAQTFETPLTDPPTFVAETTVWVGFNTSANWTVETGAGNVSRYWSANYIDPAPASALNSTALSGNGWAIWGTGTAPASSPNYVDSDDVDHMVKITQAAYDALATKDDRTLYLVTA